MDVTFIQNQQREQYLLYQRDFSHNTTSMQPLANPRDISSQVANNSPNMNPNNPVHTGSLSKLSQKARIIFLGIGRTFVAGYETRGVFRLKHADKDGRNIQSIDIQYKQGSQDSCRPRFRMLTRQLVVIVNRITFNLGNSETNQQKKQRKQQQNVQQQQAKVHNKPQNKQTQKKETKYVITVWNLKTYKLHDLQLTLGKEYRNFFLMTFHQSKLIAIVSHSNNLVDHIVYLKIWENSIQIVHNRELVLHDFTGMGLRGDLEGRVERESRVRAFDVDSRSTIGFLCDNNLPIWWTEFGLCLYSLPTAQIQALEEPKVDGNPHHHNIHKDIQPIIGCYRLPHLSANPNLPYLRKQITDLTMLDVDILYVQVCETVNCDAYSQWCWKEHKFPQGKQASQMVKYYNYSWEYKKSQQYINSHADKFINTLNIPRWVVSELSPFIRPLPNHTTTKEATIETNRPHRIQFLHSVRQLPITRQEHEGVVKAVNSKRHMCGFSRNYFLYQDDVPKYLYAYAPATGRVVGKYPRNHRVYSYFMHEQYHPHIIILFEVLSKKYMAWYVPPFLGHSLAMVIVHIMAAMQGSEGWNWDDDLLDMVCGMVGSGDSNQFLGLQIQPQNYFDEKQSQ